jgi:hypothetical protein
MITLRPLQHSWASILRQIADKLTDCSAVIAVVRFEICCFRAESVVKDLDVFVLGPGEETLEKLTEAFGAPPCSRYAYDARESYADGPVWRWPELRLTYDAPLVDLIGMGGVSGVVQLLDNFDIGLVQVAHDGVRYTIHDNFVKAIDHRTIRVVDGSWPDNARARAERMAQKFPEFTVDLSVLQ